MDVLASHLKATGRPTERGEVCIWMQEDALIVANDGRSVTRQGVLSLCASDLTEKSEHLQDLPDDIPDVPDEEFLRAIRQRTVGTYQNDPNRLKRDARRERGVSADYGGRHLWELLQNADDAMAPDGASTTHLIGTKGLGFKAVLEISDRPEVFSRPFAFSFSREMSEAVLRKEGLSVNVSAPIFEIPHALRIPPDIDALLEKGYATVIRLPFRDDKIRTRVRDAIAALDERFLLFSQHIKRLRVIFEESDITTVLDRSRFPSGGLIALSTEGDDDPATEQVWMKWLEEWQHGEEDKRLSVAICLPADASGIPSPLADEEAPPAYVFFPTEESIGMHAVVHASIELMQNRKHFLDHERNEEVCLRLKQLVARILGEIPAAVGLKAFGNIDPSRAKGIAQRLAQVALEAVKETAFVPTIGGERLQPSGVTTWGGRFGSVLRQDAAELKHYRLVHPSVVHCGEILRRLGASQFDTYSFFNALRYCKNDTEQDCKDVVTVLVRQALPAYEETPQGQRAHSFRQVPCWWTDKNSARSLDGIPLLFDRPQEWPDFLAADALSAGMGSYLQQIDRDSSGQSDGKQRNVRAANHVVWRECIFDQFLRTKRGYLEHALLPTISKTDFVWDEHGWKVLEWYRKWCDAKSFSDVSPLPVVLDRESNRDVEILRSNLAARLQVPTDKGWVPAGRSYAGHGWGGPKSFDTYFGNIPERGVLRAPTRWRRLDGMPEDLEAWKGLLRFAGVSWEPKVAATYAWPANTRVGNAYRSKYLSEFNRIEFEIAIEHFPDCVQGEGKPLALVSMGRRMLAIAQKHRARYVRPYKQKGETLPTSFAEYQLRETAWLNAPQLNSLPAAIRQAGGSLPIGQGSRRAVAGNRHIGCRSIRKERPRRIPYGNRSSRLVAEGGLCLGRLDEASFRGCSSTSR